MLSFKKPTPTVRACDGHQTHPVIFNKHAWQKPLKVCLQTLSEACSTYCLKCFSLELINDTLESLLSSADWVMSVHLNSAEVLHKILNRNTLEHHINRIRNIMQMKIT